MSRERDVRNDLHDRLLATGAFTDVWITGLPEDSGSPASDLCAAAIEPNQTTYFTGWDASLVGGLCYTAMLNVTLLARQNDQQLRDERCEQLLEHLKNSVNGQSLAGITLPGKTMVSSWRWIKPKAPERRITAVVTFQYIEEGWDAGDVEE